jgi:hypothetical protein
MRQQWVGFRTPDIFRYKYLIFETGHVNIAARIALVFPEDYRRREPGNP